MNLRNIGPAVALCIATLPAWASTCDVTVTSNDQMQFDKKSIEVPKSCKSFKVTLVHSGKLPKTVMGHNWVLSKASDMAGVAGEGMAAGAAKQYVKAGDARVIAFTKIIGGGESDSTEFDASKLEAGQEYAFYCTFPGHSAIMKGTLVVGK